MKLAIIVIIALAAVALLGAGVMVRARHPGTSTADAARAGRVPRAPAGVRVRVQVLNGTKTHGLARRATMLLRDRGFDVLEMGTLNAPRDTTLVLDLSGHPDWANRVAQVLAPARVQTRPDSSRYLDIAVILGSAWRAPAQPFYP